MNTVRDRLGRPVFGPPVRFSLSGLVEIGLQADLLRLARAYAGPDPSQAEADAAVERVRRECPGPFEPDRGFGARGAREFRRRNAGGAADESLAGRALAAREQRDWDQVQAALAKVEGI